jgi:hypothetical protein
MKWLVLLSGVLAVLAGCGLHSDSTNYCTYFTPGTAVPFTSFNTACWDGT